MQLILLGLLILIVLSLPLIYHKIEENLELFLFLCGIAALTISSAWSWDIIKGAIQEPIHISLAVLVVGIIFKKLHFLIRRVVHKTVDVIGLRWTLFCVVFLLGALSSIITAIVAALILSEVATELCLEKRQRLKLVIYSCFAISVGAILTPIGEPLGTIVMSKLQGPPHFADTLFIIKLLWPYILSALLILSFMAYKIVDHEGKRECPVEDAFHSYKDIFIRVIKVYIFVVALIFLGVGLEPLAYKTIYHLKPQFLYWVNIISAVLDNATLATIEIVPEMSRQTLTYLIVSLILGGGMMIPGNIPNIIVSSKLGIKSREWAKIALPLGFILLGGYFLILIIFL